MFTRAHLYLQEFVNKGERLGWWRSKERLGWGLEGAKLNRGGRSDLGARDLLEQVSVCGQVGQRRGTSSAPKVHPWTSGLGRRSAAASLSIKRVWADVAHCFPLNLDCTRFKKG